MVKSPLEMMILDQCHFGAKVSRFVHVAFNVPKNIALVSFPLFLILFLRNTASKFSAIINTLGTSFVHLFYTNPQLCSNYPFGVYNNYKDI